MGPAVAQPGQRVRALNALLYGVYHDREFTLAGRIPAALVLHKESFRPEMQGFDAPLEDACDGRFAIKPPIDTRPRFPTRSRLCASAHVRRGNSVESLVVRMAVSANAEQQATLGTSEFY